MRQSPPKADPKPRCTPHLPLTAYTALRQRASPRASAVQLADSGSGARDGTGSLTNLGVLALSWLIRFSPLFRARCSKWEVMQTIG